MEICNIHMFIYAEFKINLYDFKGKTLKIEAGIRSHSGGGCGQPPLDICIFLKYCQEYKGATYDLIGVHIGILILCLHGVMPLSFVNKPMNLLGKKRKKVDVWGLRLKLTL